VGRRLTVSSVHSYQGRHGAPAGPPQ
jgi:hypothetical protein